MIIAILADVHANLPALRSVLAAVDRRGVDGLLVLGDVVGYGAQPNECVELLERLEARGVIGNHDLGALGEDDPHASRSARQVQQWTAERLSARSAAVLRRFPRSAVFPWGSAVHGCLVHPLHATGYITPTTAEMNIEWLDERVRPPHVALFGHTHMPALYSRAWGDLTVPAVGTVRLPRNRVVLANPGAVGQPRDRDSRAAFALLDTEEWTFEHVRVDYDIDAAANAIRASGFDGALADRLYEGQ